MRRTRAHSCLLSTIPVKGVEVPYAWLAYPCITARILFLSTASIPIPCLFLNFFSSFSPPSRFLSSLSVVGLLPQRKTTTRSRALNRSRPFASSLVSRFRRPLPFLSVISEGSCSSGASDLPVDPTAPSSVEIEVPVVRDGI